MTRVKHQPEDGPDHIMALLGRVLDGLRRELGPAGGGPSGLRSSQLRLLSLTPREGLRVTDLAERVGMTKQALGEFATALEGDGLLETVRDPLDRRVRILRPTDRGRRAVRAAERQIGVVEARWREHLGAAEWDRLRALLVDAARLGPSAEGERLP